jgi:hypothetical protein
VHLGRRVLRREVARRGQILGAWAIADAICGDVSGESIAMCTIRLTVVGVTISQYDRPAPRSPSTADWVCSSSGNICVKPTIGIPTSGPKLGAPSRSRPGVAKRTWPEKPTGNGNFHFPFWPGSRSRAEVSTFCTAAEPG